MLGLTFKANTGDMRDAPSLDIVPALQGAGGRIGAFDPEGKVEARRVTKGVTLAETAYEAATGAGVLVVITEWHDFRGRDPRRLKEAMRQPRIVDLRNIFDPEEMCGAGCAHEGGPHDRRTGGALERKRPPQSIWKSFWGFVRRLTDRTVF